MIPDYPDGPLWRRVEREEARDELIQERADELQADQSDAGYWPWNPTNFSEAIGEMPAEDLLVATRLFSQGAFIEDAAAGLLIRRHVEQYWRKAAEQAAELHIDREASKAREDRMRERA